MNFPAPHIRTVPTSIADLAAATATAAAVVFAILGGSLPLSILFVVALAGAWRGFGRGPVLLAASTVVITLGAMAMWPAAPRAVGVPPTPTGVTAIALDGSVGLAWNATTDATSYSVYRGTTKTSVTTLVSPEGLSATSFTDTTAVNGTTYYYAVKATSSAGTSTSSALAQATPAGRSCSTGNAIVTENCFPGTAAWKTSVSTPQWEGGIEGYLTATSVNAGQSVDLKVDSSGSTTFHVEIYRTGSYGGQQGRLISVLPGIQGQAQPSCFQEPKTTGVVDCSDWTTSATITTTSQWVSGVYLLRLVRDDNGNANEAMLIVRNDGSSSDVVYKLPTNTYQAYNNYGSKALYDFLSDTPNSLTGSPRAAKVSFDRPYTQPGHKTRFDWYPNADIEAVSWLESQGYDITYIGDEDLDHAPGQALAHRVLISGVHDEYWSQGIYDAVKAARDGGTAVLFLGANANYWKVRYAASPVSGAGRRTEVTYKTIQHAPVDPLGPTTTWRDPVLNQPENALIGQMYVGDNSSTFFPLRVSASQGSHRLWRHTALHTLTAGTTASIGTTLVGWEWDSRVANGFEPAGVSTVSSTPVDGNLIQGNGATYTQGPATATSTIYKTAGGTSVFATGTNHWARGLGQNMWNEGEPSGAIRQATANVLSDMGVDPTTPVGGLQVDRPGPPSVASTSPASGDTAASPTGTVKVTLDREIDPATVSDGDIALTDSGGAKVAGSVSYDEATKTLTFQPADALEPFTAYSASVTTGIKSWRGIAPAAAYDWSFSTGQGTPPNITARTPTSGATSIATDTSVTARFDRKIDPATLTSTSFSLKPTAGGSAVAATVSYDAASRTAKLTPSASLAESTSYTANVTTAVAATDGVNMVAASTWAFTTGINLKVTSRTPAAFASGVSPLAVVRAVLNKPADAATISPSTFTVTGSGGPVAGSISYDPNTRTASFLPGAPLSLLATYTATISGARANDGSALETSTWTFATPATAPAAPGASALLPASGAVGVSNSASVSAVFDAAMDADTLTPTNVTLTPAGGSPVAATVTYDPATRKATLTPSAGLDMGVNYTATLTTAVRASTGAPLSSTVTWTFKSSNCPCSLMDNLTPSDRAIPVRDNRPAPGPWTYELGTRFTVTTTVHLVALRFWKEPGETGTHIGRLWNAAGTHLASATFTNETASGWQREPLASPVTLSPGITYTASVGVHDMYAKTPGGLRGQLMGGPLRTVADGNNGSYATTEGVFPTQTWASSNYFIDPVVKMPSEPAHAPAVASQSPLSGATGVSTATSVSATFNQPLDPSTVNTTNFTLKDPADVTVPATVTYDAETNTARLKPTAALDTGVSYMARFGTGIRGDDETPLASAVSWSFATVPPSAPTVTSGSPVRGATSVTPLITPKVVFDQPMDSATITNASFTLTGPGGASVPASVAYDAPTRTATLTPSLPLAASTSYTATVTTVVKSTRSVALTSPEVFSFTTSACPCRLFPGAVTRNYTGLSTANGRGAGTWTMEMGVKIKVTQAAQLEAVRYFRDAAETGSHVGRVWSSNGTLLASANYTGETATGWQEATLSTPVKLIPGQTYVVSVGVNSAFSMTLYGLQTTLTSGPLQSVTDGANGVWADAAGAFPTSTYGQSNYFVDAMVR